jgi:hypothetical protein
MSYSDFLTLNRKLDTLIAEMKNLTSLVQTLTAQEKIMAGELQTLTDQVAANTTAEGSAITLIEGFQALLDAAIAAGNPQALLDLSSKLAVSQKALVAAVTANTPTPTPTPPGP